MSDITKCAGEYEGRVCPKRDTCYRFTAKSNEFWQPYFHIPPFYNWNDGCDYYYRDMSKFK
jgi:hypothetical protein